MNTQIFNLTKYLKIPKGHFLVLIYVLMDNFCPCLFRFCIYFSFLLLSKTAEYKECFSVFSLKNKVILEFYLTPINYQDRFIRIWRGI